MVSGPKSIDLRLKAFRESLDLSQAEMAETMKLPQRTYANYEQKSEARIPSEVLVHLIKLGLNLNWLFAGVGEMRLREAGKPSSIENFQEAIRLVEDALQSRFLPLEEKVELITLVAEDLAEPPPGEEDIKSYMRGVVRGLVRSRIEGQRSK